MIPWYTSLQLLEFGVGVEVLLLVVVWLALLLLVSLMLG
jgi:hypothetical protein